MENEVIKYLSKFTPISKELERAIVESKMIKSYKKGRVLLKEGDFLNECYFVIKGCIRSFYLRDGEEKTTEFYTEAQSVTPSVYGKRIPSEYYLGCIEDTMAGVGTPELENQMYKKFPQLEEFNHTIAEAIIGKYQDSFAEFKMANPEQRYLNLIKTRPDLLQRVPQHQIASYLGVKPESLSRIRKRIIDKNK